MIRSLFIAATALIGVHTPAQSQAGSPTMEITRKADMTTTAGPAETFTGRVTITGQFQCEAPSRVGGAIVHFEPGARTAWHVHPLGQTLIVTEGVGWTDFDRRPKAERSS